MDGMYDDVLKVEIPRINKWDKVAGINKILRSFHDIYHTEKKVVFCLNNCNFISPEVVAILSGIRQIRDTKGFLTEIDISSLSTKVKLVLGKAKCLKVYGYGNYRYSGNSIPIFVQRDFCKEEIQHYINNEIFQRPAMPAMSGFLLKEIGRSFFELFLNIFQHSESPIGGIVCGQIYPNVKEIQIVFYDAGIGIAKSVRRVYPSISSDNAALNWALQWGHSTLSDDDSPRGLGLFVLRSFLHENNGELRIYANQGVLIEMRGNRYYKTLPIGLQGTLIDMRINVIKDIRYKFSFE